MGIGTLRCHVIDVDDLAQGEEFWSELTGLPVIGSNWTGRFSYLGDPDTKKHEIILQLVSEPKGARANRAHVDLTPEGGIDTAIERIEALGGSVKKEPSIYPRPGSFDYPPIIDWAVMQDPFGNEFCLVSQLTDEQSELVLDAVGGADGTDRYWRLAAGVTGPR